jgi:hypothetical protein
MDIAVNLVESFLRLNGYFTLSEFEVQRRLGDGEFRTITDVDIMAIRMPAARHPGDTHGDCQLLLIDDPVLRLEDDLIDVVVGEVKQGPAEFNPGIRDHAALHSILRRVEWLYGSGLQPIIDGLQHHGVATVPDRSGEARVRTRLVAFGRSDHDDLHTVPISHIVRSMLGFFEEHEDAIRPIQYRDPAPALLRLLLKAGFELEREGPS